MKRFVLTAAAGTAIALATLTPTVAFAPDRLNPALSALNDTVQVKRKGYKHRPRGWDRGRKVGWGRGHVPPGQRKR